MYHPSSLIKEIHEDRLRELGILPQRQVVRFPIHSPFPGLRRTMQTGMRMVVLALLHMIRR